MVGHSEKTIRSMEINTGQTRRNTIVKTPAGEYGRLRCIIMIIIDPLIMKSNDPCSSEFPFILVKLGVHSLFSPPISVSGTSVAICLQGVKNDWTKEGDSRISNSNSTHYVLSISYLSRERRVL